MSSVASALTKLPSSTTRMAYFSTGYRRIVVEAEKNPYRSGGGR
tara:strand:- start:48 stop:179 length:132 start_codon:yes stop_codon:yes gene_type:complete